MSYLGTDIIYQSLLHPYPCAMIAISIFCSLKSILEIAFSEVFIFIIIHFGKFLQLYVKWMRKLGMKDDDIYLQNLA
jgi:hypothetical protein